MHSTAGVDGHTPYTTSQRFGEEGILAIILVGEYRGETSTDSILTKVGGDGTGGQYEQQEKQTNAKKK